METVIDRIRAACRSRGVPISKLEKDLGFSNGYLNPKKAATVSADRLFAIASYLSVDVDYLRTGEETKKEPAAPEGVKLSDDDIKFALWGGSADQISDEELEEVRRFAAFIAERRRREGSDDR